jgi:hypothetical protein
MSPQQAMTTSGRSTASAHRRAVCAFVIISSVVNIFEQMMDSVSSGIEIVQGLRGVHRDLRSNGTRIPAVGDIGTDLLAGFSDMTTSRECPAAWSTRRK